MTLLSMAAGDTYDGQFYCSVVYTDPSYLLITASTKIAFSVVGINAMATQYALVGGNVAFTTAFYGEEPLNAVWQYKGNDIAR